MSSDAWGSFSSSPLVERAPRAPAVLGEEQSGLGPVALFLDLGGEFGALAVADGDRGADGLLELVEERLDQFLVASGVDHEPGIVLVDATAA